MKKLKPHPRLKKLDERFGSNASAIALSGFVGPSPEGVVRLFSTPSGGECVDVPQAAILDFEQADESSPTELFVDPSAIVTIVSTAKVPIVALALRVKDGGPGDGGVGKSCLDKRIESCKKDPTVKNKDFCDSKEGKQLFKFLCDQFGDPKEPSGIGGGFVIV